MNSVIDELGGSVSARIRRLRSLVAAAGGGSCGAYEVEAMLPKPLLSLAVSIQAAMSCIE